MTIIRVNPEELEQTAYQLQSGIREMDASIRDAYQQLHGIRDRARGLDDIRSRAADLYRMHRSQHDAAEHVQQHLVQSAQRFGGEDRQLADMLHTRHMEQMPIWQQMLATAAIGTLTYGQLLDMMGSFADGVEGVAKGINGALGGYKDFIDQFALLEHLNRTDVREFLLQTGRNANQIAQFLGVDAHFVGKMQGVYDAIKGFVPDGRTTVGKFLHEIGTTASSHSQMISGLMSYGSTALRIIDLVSPTIDAFQTGDFRDLKDKALTSASEMLVDKFVYGGLGLVLAGTATATVGGAVAAGVGLTVAGTEAIQFVGGYAMKGLEWAGYSELAKDGQYWLDQIEVKDRLVSGTKWAIEGLTTGTIDVINNPQQSLQNSVNYVADTVSEIGQGAKVLYQSTVQSAEQIKNQLFSWLPG